MKAALNAMFSRIIPETFSMSSNKISFLISEVIGSYLNTLNNEDVKKSSSLFTSHYKEASD